ncbi:hypothetical protein VPHD518_0095 [Vibrio phage D518]
MTRFRMRRNVLFICNLPVGCENRENTHVDVYVED